jgi:putative ABC transport system permease protein
MLKHFFKIAIRNLLRRKVYSFINITGLAVGMACCLLISIYVSHELSYDRYHKNADRTWRVVHAFRSAGMGKIIAPPAPADYQVWGNAPIGPAMLADFPEIDKLAQFTSPNTLLLQYADNRFQQDNLLFIDSTAFDVFGWTMISGNPHTALVAPNSIVLPKSVAAKYFGRIDPLGKVLKVENNESFTVTGVMEDVPTNSQISFDGLISMTTFRKWRAEVFDWWGYVDFYTYFTLKPNTSIGLIKSKAAQFVKRRNPDDKGYSITFEKLTDAYMRSEATRQPGPTGSLTNMYIFSFIAVFILLIACINFMNLSTARSMERSKEVGMRKVLGAFRNSLMRQFLAESVLLAFLSAILAVLIAIIALPSLGELVGKDFSGVHFFTIPMILLITVLTVVIGILAGIYPAWFLAGFQTISVLKGVFNTGGQGVGLRKALVVFQFTLSVILIAGTGVIFSQLEHLRSHDLGFKKDQMVVIDFGGDGSVRENIEMIKNRLRANPNVLSVSSSRAIPGDFLPNAGTDIEAKGGDMVNRGPLIYEIDYDFLPQYQVPLVAGRYFSRQYVSDSVQALIINEACARLYGYSDPAEAVGKKYQQWGNRGVVIGVVKDFNFRSLHLPVEPLSLRYGMPWSLNKITLRVKPGNFSATIAALKKTWDEVAPQRPFLYSFLDESFSKQYEADAHFGQLVSLFSTLAIFIACLGLFGLVSFTAEQKTKEIGIRKVLGSSVTGIVTLMSKDFIRLVIIAIVIAVPVSWWSMTRWLEEFPYRVQIPPMLYIRAALLAILIAAVTIGWQSIRAALANPIKAIKSE